MRDLCQARDAARLTPKKARLRLKGFLLRLDFHYVGRVAWNDAHLRNLAKVVEYPLGNPSESLTVFPRARLCNAATS